MDNTDTEHTQLSASAFLSWHPALRKMRRTIEPHLEDYSGEAFAILARLAILNGREAFWGDEVRP